jgi:hypothetical protein
MKFWNPCYRSENKKSSLLLRLCFYNFQQQVFSFTQTVWFGFAIGLSTYLALIMDSPAKPFCKLWKLLSAPCAKYGRDSLERPVIFGSEGREWMCFDLGTSNIVYLPALIHCFIKPGSELRVSAIFGAGRTVNLQATSLLHSLVIAMRKRLELKVFYIAPPPQLDYPPCQFPNAIPIAVPGFSILCYLKYFRLRKQFDLVLQSDYQPILPLSWIARQNLLLQKVICYWM